MEQNRVVQLIFLNSYKKNTDLKTINLTINFFIK